MAGCYSANVYKRCHLLSSFFSSIPFFFSAKFLPANKQRPVQSVVEGEARLGGGVSISHQSPVISTVSSKWLKNILVYIFNIVSFNYLSLVYVFVFFLSFLQTINTIMSNALLTCGVIEQSQFYNRLTVMSLNMRNAILRLMLFLGQISPCCMYGHVLL